MFPSFNHFLMVRRFFLCNNCWFKSCVESLYYFSHSDVSPADGGRERQECQSHNQHRSKNTVSADCIQSHMTLPRVLLIVIFSFSEQWIRECAHWYGTAGSERAKAEAGASWKPAEGRQWCHSTNGGESSTFRLFHYQSSGEFTALSVTNNAPLFRVCFQSRPSDSSSQTATASAAAPPPPSSSSTTSTPSPSSQPMDTSPPPTTPPPPPTSSAQSEGPTPQPGPKWDILLLRLFPHSCVRIDTNSSDFFISVQTFLSQEHLKGTWNYLAWNWSIVFDCDQLHLPFLL